MDRFLKDLRYGLRMLARAPGVTALALLSLGLGIGANTTIFTWTRATLLNPLPGVEDVDRLALVLGRLAGGRMISVSVPDYLDYRDRSQTFSGVVAHSMYPLIARIDAEPENVWSEIVSGNFFDVLGVEPIVGRTFLPEEDRTPGTHAVTVISERLWPQAIGAAMLAPFSLLALLLASMGLYGVMSFAVSQRRQEIGIRMALVTDRRSVHRLFVRRGVLLTLIGTILGVLIIVPVGRLVETLLLGASATDPVVFLTVIAVLWGAAFLACSIPASRASRYDPIRALRYE